MIPFTIGKKYMIKIRNHFFELQYHFTDNRILLQRERFKIRCVYNYTWNIYIYFSITIVLNSRGKFDQKISYFTEKFI